jgi:hypothetical protein
MGGDRAKIVRPENICIMRWQRAMTIKRLSGWVFALLTVALASTARAEPWLSGFNSHDLQWDHYHDLQPFSPVVNYDYGGEPVGAQYGWYFSYDRVYLNLTRGDTAPNWFDGDFSWGNRFDVGYMSEADRGWLLSTTYYLIGDPRLEQINMASFTSIEFERVWRLDPFYHQCFLEPFGGVRFVKFNDKTEGFVENNMLGGQLGCRLFKQVRNFVISGEFRMFAMHNWEFFKIDDMILEEFVWGGETRAEVAYLLTRDVAIRAGWQTIYFGQGVARQGLAPIFNDESVFVSGLTFGFTVNR